MDLSFFANRRIVITGASGYVAHSLVQALKDVECTIVLFSRNAVQSLPDTSRAEFITCPGEYGNRADVDRALVGAQTIFHLAAQTSVYRAANDPGQDQKDNLFSLLTIVASMSANVPNADLVFGGTVTQVGLAQNLPVSEEPVDLPVTLYDLHKLMGEMYVEYFARMGTIRGTTLRFPNIYGPGPATSSNDRGVMNLMMRRALSGEALSIYGEGKEIRDYLHVSDLASALLHAAANMDRVNGKHYVLGTGEGNTIAGAINLIADRAQMLTGKRAPVIHVESPAGLSPIEKRSFVADTTRFRRDTGWAPGYSLLQGVDHTLNHMRRSLSQEP